MWGGGGIREFSSTFEPKFYTCTVSRQLRPEGGLSSRWSADDCIVYYSMGWVRGDNSTVYDVYALAARWTVHAKKIDIYGSYRTYIIFDVDERFKEDLID